MILGFGDPQPGLILVNSDDSASESGVDMEVTKNAESSIDDEGLEVFQPTAEWQTIQLGQGIPPGLHVRMNLQTGQKEAKLMDGDDGSKYQSNKDSKQKFITIDRNVISKQHLKEVLKDFRDKFHDESPGGESSDQLNRHMDASRFIALLLEKELRLFWITLSPTNKIKDPLFLWELS